MLSHNPESSATNARKLTQIDVDAFAGTACHAPAFQPLLFPKLEEPETEAFLESSTLIELKVELKFEEYLFNNPVQYLDWAPNIWMGVSVENRRVIHRIHDLQAVPAYVRFLSCEPLLGPLDDLPLDEIHWVIVGGESGPGARPMQAEWVRSILEQCRRAHVPFFFKQWGGVRKDLTGRELDGCTYDEMPLNGRQH